MDVTEFALRLSHKLRVPTPANGEAYTRAKGVSLAARIDAGNWVVDCPYCNGAELADPDGDRHFYCMNRFCPRPFGNLWIAVTFPRKPDRDRAIRVLLHRTMPILDLRTNEPVIVDGAIKEAPDYDHRYWMPGVETVDQLCAENIEHGLDTE